MCGMRIGEHAKLAGVNPRTLRDTGMVPCRHVRSLAESKVSDIDARIIDLGRLAEAARQSETACALGSSVCIAFEEATEPSP